MAENVPISAEPSQESLYAQDTVKILSDDDFDLESDTKINLSSKDCILVLFHNNNAESKNVLALWTEAAKEVAGPIFAVCDLNKNRYVARSFTRLNMTAGGLKWAALRTIPFIMVYQNGWPVAFYNGDRSVQTFIDYALALACRADYHEPINYFAGMQAENNLEIKGTEVYGKNVNNPFRHDSLEFNPKKPLRPYDKNDHPVEVGSPEAKQAAATEEQAAASQGIPTAGLPTTRVETPAGQQVEPTEVIPDVIPKPVAAPTSQQVEQVETTGVVPGEEQVAAPTNQQVGP